MPTHEPKGGTLILRDLLALDRTDLANEWTLLAYLRTALMSLISGVTLIKLFADNAVMVIAGYALLPLALVVGIIGGLRFAGMRRRIHAARTVPPDGDA
jgi:putative membrane protein